MKFRSDRTSGEWLELIDRGSLLVPVASMYDMLHRRIIGADCDVTSILRTTAEQEQLCLSAGIKPYRSVHEFWRGLDISVMGQDFDEVQEMVGAINTTFKYGGRFLVAAFHARGTGPHVHLQVPAARIWAGE